MVLDASSACYRITWPAQARFAPVVFASPHSGRDYDPEFVASTRLALPALRRSEDCFVDEIYAAAPHCGAPLLAARFPRIFCDVNREAWELDPTMFEDRLPSWANSGSARVNAGLGTIPRIVANGEPIYPGKLRVAEAERRIRGFWQPYHAALRQLVDSARTTHGVCLLVDCHSMPAQATRQPGPGIVLGDAHGSACAPSVTARMERFLIERGYQVRRNDPYAGGYVTRHYGERQRGVHAIQVELARHLYMDEATLEKNAGFERVSADMADLARLLTTDGLALLGGA
jgi:N-formylglutamate deformylase